MYIHAYFKNSYKCLFDCKVLVLKMWHVSELLFFLSMKTLIQRQYSGSVWKYYLALALFRGTLPWHPLISRHLTSTGQNPLIRRPFWELMGQVWGMREKQDAASNSHHRCTGPDFSPALWLIMLLHLFFVYIWQSPTE